MKEHDAINDLYDEWIEETGVKFMPFPLTTPDRQKGNAYSERKRLGI